MDKLFPSNFSGFSIFNLEVSILGPFTGGSACPAAPIPAPTSLAISSGVNMVASCVLMGSAVPGGCLPVGRFCMNRSSSFSLGGGKGEGEGEPTGWLGPGGGPVLPPPAFLTAGNGGSGGSGGLDGGMVGRLCLRVVGAGVSRIGLWRVGRIGKGGDAAGADAALVLGILARLHQSYSGSGEGALGLGDPGRSIQVAIRRISYLARRNSSSTLLIFL